MKIDILREPPEDIFKDQSKFTLLFILFLALACIGLLLGAYAIFFHTRHYGILETASLITFGFAALFLFYVGEKLQAYRKLTPPQQKELAELGQKYFEIQGYCDRVVKSGRRIIFAEYEACRNWAEDKRMQAERDVKY